MSKPSHAAKEAPAMTAKLQPVPATFWIWALWRRRGGLPAQRPAEVAAYIREHGKIPKAWFAEYKRRGFQPIKPAPAPSPLGIFATPGWWLSWAISSTGWTPASIADQAHAGGASWVALDATVRENTASFKATKTACAKVGITAGLWGQIHSAELAAAICVDAGATFYIAQNEGKGQTEPEFPRIFREHAPTTELGLVAGPFDGLPHPHVDPAGWETDTKPWLTTPILVEAYTPENSNATPTRQAGEAGNRGFTAIAVVLEANEAHGWELDDPQFYDLPVVHHEFGGAVSLYLGEAASANSRKVFKEQLTGP